MEDVKLLERVSALESSHLHLTKNVDRLATSIDKLVESEIHSRRTPWGTIISAMGLVIVLVGAIGSAWIAPINVRLEEISRRADRISDAYKRLEERLEKAQTAR